MIPSKDIRSVSAALPHRPRRFRTDSMGFVSDQCYYHAVQIEEEHDEMEAELDKRFLRKVEHVSTCTQFSMDRIEEWTSVGRVSDLLVDVQLPKDFRCVKQMLIFEYPNSHVSACASSIQYT